ncbi:MFS transporter [Bradyrhizobium sp. BWA-3-5]|uniref:MFS transporter n=1 Tax=Bradyrhizobium sp. BWA-3-5 TaxID=3080013 RepID=UPI00293F46BA|nr:MFS transporter [Bradyrhizobium sp. BWA-3-5]WOH63769.1 MFS transporter [Bradyrhizobium sp. BWA-3-5]
MTTSVETTMTPQLEAVGPSKAGKMGRLALASMVGTSLEWYEFVIYNSMAALVFNKLFFPSFDPIVGTILAFSTYAVGYVSRPIGGIIFGRLGDKVGRRAVLVYTLALMGFTTLAMGLIPTYASIGIAAPLLLVSLRTLQGIALGGEWAGAILLSVEHGNPKNRGLNASWTQMGPSAGTLLAAGAIAITTTVLNDADFLLWGWRLPFFASAILVIFGFWIRWSVEESPHFSQLQAGHATTKAPIAEVLGSYWRNLLIAGSVRIGSDVVYGLLAVFTLTYVTQKLGLSRTLALTAVLLGAGVHAISIPLLAALSDRIGRRVVYGAGALGSIVGSFLLFGLLDTKSPAIIIVSICIGMIFQAAMFGPQGAFVTEQFPTRVRYTGSSLAYTFAGVLGGGFAPLIFATLLREYPNTYAIPAYVTGALAITLVALFAATEKAGRDID